MTEISEMGKMIQSTPNTTKATLEGIAIPVNTEVSVLEGGESREGYRRTEVSRLLKGINHDCASMKCTLGYALRIAYETVKIDTDATVYGMIWASNADDNFRLNILHPIVASSIIQGEYDKLVQQDSEGTLYVYEYTNKQKYAPNASQAEYAVDRWVEILGVITTESYSPNTTLTCSTNMGSLCGAIRQGSTSMESASVSFSESGSNPRMVITPTMFVTQDMLFPYYGAIQSRQSGGSYESRDLLPMGSCNLNHSTNIGHYGGTCTGNLSNSVYASLRVLTNLNTGSPHHMDVISNGLDIRTYVRTTQEVSAEIIYEAHKDSWVFEEEPVTPSQEVLEEDLGLDTKVINAEGTPEVVVTVVKKRGRPSKASQGGQ